jgi:hypothetical protein
VKESFANVNAEGMLENRYDKWYGLEHIVIDFLRKMKVASTEKNVVFYLLCIQLFFSSLGVIIFLINNSLL